MLSDIQIQQLNDYRASLQAQLTELTDQRARFDNYYQQKIELEEGKKKKRRIAMQAKLAQLDSEQQQIVKEMQNQQAQLIEQMQADFEESLTKIQQMDVKQVKQIEKQYGAVIKDLENKLEKYQETNFNEEEDYDDQESEIRYENKSLAISDEQVEQLQQLIKQKQDERASNLMMSKEQLLQCVKTLEENEEEHRTKMNALKKQLCDEEQEYYHKVMSIKEQSKRILPPLKKLFREREQKFKLLQQKISEFKSESDTKMKPLLLKSEAVREKLTSVTRTTRQIKPKVDIIDVTSKTNEIKAKIKDREAALKWEQDMNNALKQQICKLQFTKQTISRRRSLKL